VPRAPLLSGRPVVERRRDLPLTGVLALQRAACERAGSALYARIIDAMVDDVGTGGVCAGVLAPWAGNAMADAIPLRFLAAVHELVLTGEAPALAEHYPSAGGSDDGDPVPAFLATVEAHRDRIAGAMDLGVQTNEVGRATSLFGGFHAVARRSGLPLRQLEVGASAGLGYLMTLSLARGQTALAFAALVLLCLLGLALYYTADRLGRALIHWQPQGD